MMFAFLSKSGATYRFFEETLLGTLPGRRYTLHRRLQRADVLIEPGYSLARIHAARSFYQPLGYTTCVFVTSSDATAVRQELTVHLADEALHGLCTLRAIMTGDTLQEMVPSCSAITSVLLHRPDLQSRPRSFYPHASDGVR